MNIEELVDMAEWIHNDEGYNLGASSTRDERNAFWMRVVGCAYWGHPVYNAVPDTQWHVKDAGGGRPMSDDVAASLPSRSAWDCIPGSGSDTYRFEADAIGVLPADQHVYAPDRPEQDVPVGVGSPYPGDEAFDEIGMILWADYAEAGRVPDAQVGRWFGRTINDYLSAGMTLDASIDKHRAEWRTALGLD